MTSGLKAKFNKLEIDLVSTIITIIFSLIVVVVVLDMVQLVKASVPCVDDPVACGNDVTAPAVTFSNTETLPNTDKIIRFSSSDGESGIASARIKVSLQGSSATYETQTGLNPSFGSLSEDYVEFEYIFSLDSIYDQLGEDGTYEFFAIVTNGNGIDSTQVALTTYFYTYVDPNQLSVSLLNSNIPFNDPYVSVVVDSATNDCTQPLKEIYTESGGVSDTKTYSSGYYCEVIENFNYDALGIGSNKTLKVRLRDNGNVYWPGPGLTDYFNLNFNIGHAFYVQMDPNYPTSETPEIRFTVINDSATYYSPARDLDSTMYFQIPGYSPANTIQNAGSYYYLDISDLNLDQNQQYQFNIRLLDTTGDEYPRFGEFFSTTFDFGIFPEPILNLSASDNENGEIHINYNAPNDQVNMIRVQRITGACSAGNHHTDHTSGVTVQESIDPQLNEPLSYIDSDVQVGGSYCYAAFTQKQDVWNDSLIWGFSGNYDTGFVGGDNEGPIFTFIEKPLVLNKMSSEQVGIAFDLFDEYSIITDASYTAVNSRLGFSSSSLTPIDGSFDGRGESFGFDIGAAAQDGDTITMSFSASDALGNVTTLNNEFVINVISNNDPPVVTLETYEEDPTDNVRPVIYGYAYDPNGVLLSSIQFRVNGGEILDWTNVSVTDELLDESQEYFTLEMPFDLPDGNNLFEVRAINANNNVAQEGNYARELITIQARDSTAPLINIFELPETIYDFSPKIHVEVIDDYSDLTSNIKIVEYSLNNTDWFQSQPLDDAYDEVKEEFDIELENLDSGAHTLYIRAEDYASNTTYPGETYSLAFTISEQDPNLEAQKITLSEDFNDSSKSAKELTTAIWGNGIARLAVDNSINRTALSNTYLAPRYSLYSGEAIIERSMNGGFWVNVNPDGDSHQFIFVSDSNITTLYDLAVLHSIPEITNQAVNDIKVAVRDGKEHLAVLTSVGLITIDTNNSPENPNDDTIGNYINYGVFSGRSQFSFAEVIDTGDGDFGVLVYNLAPAAKLTYVKALYDLNDESAHLYYDVTNSTLIAGGGLTKIKKQPGTNNIWIAKNSNNNIVRWNFGNIIDDESDDNVDTFDVQHTRDVIWDSHGNSFVAVTGGGIKRIDSEGSVSEVISYERLGSFDISSLYFLSGGHPVGSQFLAVAIGSGYVYHIYPNNTYDDPFDDQIIKYDLALGEYPADEPRLYIDSDNKFYANLPRYGVFSFDVERDFEDSNVAISLTSADQHLYSNFIRLESASISAYNHDLIDDKDDSIFSKVKNFFFKNAYADSLPSNIRIQVTNNGVDWFDIDVGELVEFPTSDYRVRFRILLDKVVVNETPIVDDLLLTYAAYKDESSVGVSDFNVTFSKSRVAKGEAFNITINAVDSLGFPVDSVNGHLTFAARKVGSSLNSSFLSIDSADMINGVASVNDLTFNGSTDLGTYQLYVKYNDVEAVSNSGIIVAGSVNNVNNLGNNSNGVDNPKPSLTFTADRYQIKKGESVSLSWTSQNLTSLEIEGRGVTNLNGSLMIVPDKTTTYTLKGTGPYGDLSTELTIIVDGAYGDFNAEIDKIQITEGESVKISWTASDSDFITISGLDGTYSPVGSIEIYPELIGENEYVLTANYSDGTRKIKVLKVEVLALLSVSDNSSGVLGETAEDIGLVTASLLVITAGTLGAMTFLNKTYKYGIIGILIPRQKKYWGIVFDEKESKPIPFANVRVYTSTEELISQTVSDMDGRYALLVDEAGDYKLEVQASGYEKLEREIKISKISDNLEVTVDIGLYKLGEDYGFLTTILRYERVETYKLFRRLLLALSVIGLGYSIYTAIQNPLLVNYLILIFYGIIFSFEVYHFFDMQAWGKVVESKTLKGLGGVIVRIFDSKSQLSIALSNKNGQLKLKLGAGKYKLSALKTGFKLANDSDFIDIEIDKNGHVTSDIVMSPTGESNQEKTTLTNPFS